MKQIVIIGSKNAGSKNDVGAMARSLQEYGLEAELHVYNWEDLVFAIDDAKQSVVDSVSGADVASADLVIAMGWYKTGAMAFYRDMAFTVALYLQKAGTQFWNSEMLHQRSTTKLSAMMQLALEGISVPRTVFSLSHSALVAASGTVFPMVVKTIAGSRGANNHLAQNADELQAILVADGDNVPYMVEECIPNDHDLRVVCYGGKPAMVIKRSRTNTATHLNNTSQGAVAELLPLEQVDQSVLQVCQDACRILGREIAGVDILLANDGSQRMVCLEVNALPQLTSGSYVPEKSKRLTTALNEYVKGTA